MKAALIVKQDGLIYVNGVPEEPKNCYNTSCSQWCVCPQMKDYQKALASAKESAILVSDQEHAKRILYPLTKHKINASFGEWEANGLKPGIYPIPDLKWEVKEGLEYPIDHTSYPPYRKVAILTPLKPENKTMMKTGIELITEERREQIEKHGWTSERDAKYTADELVDAAMQYLGGDLISCWPEIWDKKWYKPGDRIDELKRAGALIAAEIDRIQNLKKI